MPQDRIATLPAMFAEASDKISHDGALSFWTRTRQGIERDGWPSFASKAMWKPVRPVLVPLAGRRLRHRASHTTGIEQLLDLTFDFRAFGISIRPAQMRWELGHLLQEVDQIRPRSMLEIGTANGGSLFAMAQMCAPDAHIISVDLPRGSSAEATRCGRSLYISRSLSADSVST